MKIVTQKLDKGLVVVVPEHLDDLWHLYNVILPNDQVAARTVRRVRREDKEESRPDKGERRPLFIRLIVEEATLHKYSNRLRVKGRILEGPEDLISLGAFHTLNIEPGTKVEIVKTEWPRHLLRRLRDAASRKGQRLLLIAVEDDSAVVCVIDDTGVDVRAELRGRAGGKYGKYLQSPELTEQIFTGVATLVKETLDRLPDVMRIVVVGPGSAKDGLAEFLQQRVPAAKGRVLLDHVSTGTISGVYEAIHRGIVERVAGDIRLNREIRLMDDLMTQLGKGTGKAAYGWDEVERAVQFGAVEALLVLDKTWREAPVETRQKLENLMRQVEERGGSVDFFSADHEAGKQLAGLGGVAATLRFALPTA
jgi:protein pelota